MSATSVAPDPLAHWVERLSSKDMPIFGATMAAIGEVAENDASPTSALGRIILRDAGMTARVLRMANSVFFRGESGRINTISRAIVLLGFDTVRNIAISVALIDTFLAGGVRERVSAEMARCFHGAVHARHAAAVRGDASPEEVFIATLLSRIGELAFWCFSDEAGQELDRVLRRGATAEQAEAEVLGFRLRTLTQLLAREWALPPLVVSACADNVRADSREGMVVAGYRLASAAESGWDGERARAALRDYARVLRQDVASVAPVVSAHAREAALIAGFYGCDDAALRIPVPERPLDEIEDDRSDAPAHEADPLLQLEFSRRMVALVSARSVSGTVLDLALEAAGSSLGADRAVLALVAANRSQLVARSTHGHGAQQLVRHFNFLLAGAPRDALTELVEHGRVIDVAASHVPAPGVPAITRLRAALGDRHQLLVPIQAHGQVVGVLHIDRSAARPPFPAGTADALLHFARLAGIALEMSARPR